jgi:dipeptidyl aminopeptidase/acylaminoacyl peptidase
MPYRKLFLALTVIIGLNVAVFSQKREVGNLVIDGVPEIPERIVEKMNQYQNVRSASFLGWNPNGAGLLISTRFGESSQIHYVEHPGGARQQLTFFKEPVSSARYYPANDKRGFIFGMDTGGSEFYQIFYFNIDNGQTTLLTDGRSRNVSYRWSNDGKWIAFTSNLRNGKDNDIRLMSTDKPGTSDLLVGGQGEWRAVNWSSDDTKLLVQNYVSANESYLYWCDITSKKLTQINPQKDKKISYGSAHFSRDGRGIYYTSDESGEFLQLTYHDLTTNKKNILTANIPWDIDEIEISDDGKKLAYVVNEDGISKLHVIDTQTQQEIQLPDLPIGLIFSLEFSKNGNDLGMAMNTYQTPGDVYSIKFDTRQLIRWTFSEVGGLNTSNFVPPQLIRYLTFDKIGKNFRTIPAFYYKPKKSNGKFPVIISIHGGPESQELPAFSSIYQYLVNELGIAVIAPNVRGSTGYGKTYLTLDNGYKREDSVKDIGALLDWIGQQPELDVTKVGVWGGSYGGYMVLATMFNYNDRIRAGVDIVGISNFVTFLENTQEYRRDLRRVEYGDERDVKMREFLNKISPTTNAHKITKPLFVVQGLNDPRVPASEAEQIVNTVRKNNGKIWYLLAKDEGHGFRKKSNRDYYLNAVSFFWEEFLLK